MRKFSSILVTVAILFAPVVNAAEPAEPFRIIGNIYWVGGEYGSYLITTPEGHILHDTGTSEMHDLIVANVEKLGFKVSDIRIMISSHAHFDHVQGHAAMKSATGAQVVALGGDATALAAGQDNSAGGFPGLIAVGVDRVIADGDTVTLGGVTLRAFWTPGHTQGATMWMTTVQENGSSYDVAFRGGEIPNAGVPLIDNPRHPTVVADTQKTLQRLKELDPPDLVLHNHPQNLGRPLNPSLPVNANCFTASTLKHGLRWSPVSKQVSPPHCAKQKLEENNHDTRHQQMGNARVGDKPDAVLPTFCAGAGVPEPLPPRG